MIRHIVMWRVRGDTPEEKAASRQLVKKSFEGLRGRIPGMTHLEIGLDSSAVDYACDVVLVTDFESQQALDNYAQHPEHLRVKQVLGDVRIARFQVDYQVDYQVDANTQRQDSTHAPT
ncbi:Dabb family protein [Paraburkholderia xenovorans]|uniref:Dabb family protein n=1 Tax=Paraburkholderia xenovorans TaxID=36873 RepID=UPI0038BC607D